MTCSRLPLPLTLVLLAVSFAGGVLPGTAHAKDTDANALGFKAYGKKHYKKAHGLFEKALKQNPSNAYARLNRARTTTLLQSGKKETDDFDYCALHTNWIFQALADLSRAVELDRAALLPKIDEDQTGLKALKALDEYKKWRQAVSVLTAEAGTEKVLRDTPHWLIQAPGQVPLFISLKPDHTVTEQEGDRDEKTIGQWSLKEGQLSIGPSQGKARPWKVEADKSFFNQGQDFFFATYLVPQAEEAAAPGSLAGPWSAGPLTDDCM
ncbi:hypothetical protein POL68_42580 [Stigmatella sp. ncwal1]|uniref:Tetratricopeptide repeat protein n=1 Tax=Stigmatella ashevillensis TaxID=2995309 RepID=A0ABT5DNI5_9BACT|nr:hypothetical protein [Stigmatella ashevillena]MDC0715212.1 hypothetical protein [Stigmatella ashevillena]